MNSYIKNLNSNFAADKGFTLIELLLAVAIMSIVVSLAGTGLIAILEQNQTAKLESERRTNLNRALDYIANEIRSSRNIQTLSSIPNALAPGLPLAAINVPANTTGVLRLDISSQALANFHVVYYVANSTRWDSPKSIIRETGNYSYVSTSTISAVNNTKVLVDGIKAPTSAKVTAITNSCTSNGGNFYGADGFYACIYRRTLLIGDKVDLYLYGKLSNDTNETIEVQSTVVIRAVN
jgi:prepilin-type N-terminal cleavage/methylation domain-containing protein